MKLPYSRKTLRWPTAVNRKKAKKKGATSLISVFLFILFSTLGLSMLYFTGIYLRVSAYKKNSTLLEYASENGIKQGFHHLLGLLAQVRDLSPLTPEELEAFRVDTLNQGSGIAEELIGQTIPLQTEKDWENLNWQSTTDLVLERIEENDTCFNAIYTARILSEGKIDNFKPVRASSLEASLGILAGRLPLPSIPLLVDKKLDAEQKDNFTEENDITLIPSRRNSLPPRPAHSEGDLIPGDALPQLQKALNIKLFSPFDLSNRVLRGALGLEESDEPVPEAVYLIEDDLGLGGIYVQGDLEEMVLAIEEQYQVVSFLSEQGCWVLKFSPRKSKTVFITPEETRHFDLSPRGIIIVNGKILSFGGGIVDPFGRAVLVTEEEIPSILQGVILTIISSDRITLSSHLIHQGVKWLGEIPYVKYSKSQLNLFVTGQDFLEEGGKDGKIIISEDSPQDLKIQASLTACGKGFSIEGRSQTVHILGSLQASDYESNDNALRLTFDERLAEMNELIQDAPQTIKPVLFLSHFMPLEWKEFR